MQDTIENLEKMLKSEKLKYDELWSQKESISVQHRQATDTLKKRLAEENEFKLDSDAKKIKRKKRRVDGFTC